MAQPDLTFTDVFRKLIDEEAGQLPVDFASGDRAPFLPSADEIIEGLSRNQFQIYFQPQVNSRTRRAVGAEALIRWFHPVHGLVPTHDFIAVAERSDVIHDIGTVALRSAVLFADNLMQMGFPLEGRVAVNISAREMDEPARLLALLRTMSQFKLPTHLIELELTETRALKDLKRAAEAMHRMHEFGVQFAIDDFGTGYSTLESVAELPFSTVKIDMCFVRRLEHSDMHRRLTEGIIDFCHFNGMRTVAEGVETAAQADFLADWGCDFLQGFYFSPAVSVANFHKKTAW